MPRRTYWIQLLLLAFAAALLVVLFTVFFQNNTLATFPTHDDVGSDGFMKRAGYGWPLAFSEQVSLIDTISTHYHWGCLLLNLCLVAPIIILPLHWMGCANWIEIDAA